MMRLVRHRTNTARQLSQDYLNSLVAAWTRKFFSHRSWVAATLATVASIAFLSAIPLRHWQFVPLLLLLISAGVGLANAVVRLLVGDRLPNWTIHIDVIAGNIFISIAVAAAATAHVNLANLYLLVAFFAFLYLPLRSAAIHLTLSGIAYALVLLFGTPPNQPPIMAWLSVLGTAVALGLVVVGLVSMLRMTAREDPLTGLANRRLWHERLEEEMERAKRTESELSVIMIDLDGFKAVNDTEGHDAGDRLLQRVAWSFKGVIRGGGDFLARLGGDEFGIIVPSSGEIGVRSLASRLTDALPGGISASVGIAFWDQKESATELMRRADQAMYTTKRRRRNREPPRLA